MPCTSTSSRTICAPDAFASAIRFARSASGVQQVWIIECDWTEAPETAGTARPSAVTRAAAAKLR
jgi:hypothetical protein